MTRSEAETILWRTMSIMDLIKESACAMSQVSGSKTEGYFLGLEDLTQMLRDDLLRFDAEYFSAKREPDSAAGKEAT